MRSNLVTIASILISVTSFVMIYITFAPRVLDDPKYCQPVGGHTYCIPVEYFILPPIDPTGLLVRVNYPDMTSVPLNQSGGVLVAVSDTHQQSLSLTCDPVSLDASIRSQCQHRFQLGALAYTVTFDRALLLQQSDIRASAIRFIETFKK